MPDPPTDRPSDRGGRRSFGPTVLVGLAAGTLAAVAATRSWAHATGTSAGVDVGAAAKGSSSAPLAIALSLVALAAWGVVLVLRGRVRRAVAGLGALASAGALVATLAVLGSVRDDAVRAVVARGATGHDFGTSLTGWYWTCSVAALLCLGAFVVAVRAVPRWPEMGSRYDAPAGRAEQPPAEQDMWRALDEGHDPTDG